MTEHTCRQSQKDGLTCRHPTHLVTPTVKNLAACSAGDPGKIPWRKNWQPTPIFLPGESHGEPGELQPLGLHKVGHDLATKEQNCGEENHFSA